MMADADQLNSFKNLSATTRSILEILAIKLAGDLDRVE
jgi:hypothetical protein